MTNPEPFLQRGLGRGPMLPPAPCGEGRPCPRCIGASMRGIMNREAIQPLPEGVLAPRSRADGQPCCYDCAAADAMDRLYLPDWNMARTAVSNDRQEQLRLPGVPMGMVYAGIVRPSSEGDLERHHAWLDQHHLWRADDDEA